MDEQSIYRYKKDAPDYKENRHKYLIQRTKDRYKNDEDFRTKMKETSKKHYDKLKEASKILEEIKKKMI
jgi:hypothetical protein